VPHNDANNVFTVPMKLEFKKLRDSLTEQVELHRPLASDVTTATSCEPASALRAMPF
jgi:hypothetical protein